MKLQDYRKLLGLSRAKAASQLGTTGFASWMAR